VFFNYGLQVKCLVSGATGFIGRELCRQLATEEVSFTALSCGGGPLPDGTPTVAVDLFSQSVDSRLLEGVDVVFHLAGIAHQEASERTYSQVNHLATLSLAKAAVSAGVKCFVYLSSVKAMGAPLGNLARIENQGELPNNAYGLSKLRAEQSLQTELNPGGMSVVILRPSLVYGPGVKGNLRSLNRAVRAGIPRPPEAGGRSMVAVQDLATLMRQIASEPPLGTHTWIVCDGQSYSARRIYDLMREALGKSPGVSWLPLWAWRLGAFLADGLRDKGADSTFLKLFGTELYNGSAVSRELSWQPKYQLADLMSDSMAAQRGPAR
jgi:nucleoside-diphosphate-sugar epimerase